LDKIVYDAATTSGGSGGSLFNCDGKVIGVNFATLSDLGGSNFAVPVRYADELLWLCAPHAPRRLFSWAFIHWDFIPAKSPLRSRPILCYKH
jgi:hypothetical protein